MIIRGLKLTLILLFSMQIDYKMDIIQVEKKLDIFYQKLSEESLNYGIGDEVFITYNYEQVEKISRDIFNKHEIRILKYNSTFFIIEIIVNKGIYKDVIREKYQIQRGNLYEKLN